MTVVELTQAEYINLLATVKNDPKRRMQMKQFAHSAMYSGNPDAKVYLPIELVEEQS